MQTHENYIRSIAEFAIRQGDLTLEERTTLGNIKLVYGSGPNGTRGVTFYNKWKSNGATVPFVEVAAFGQESIVQLTGTTLHELGHVLTGWTAGHGPAWHEACAKVGLRKIKAAGTCYVWANFLPYVREFATSIEKPQEGEPVASLMTGNPFTMGTGMPVIKGCQAGIGTRGGKSRGVGSGSRLRLFQCACERPVKVRIASDAFDATHNPCSSKFHRV